jgi:hypothetical protein
MNVTQSFGDGIGASLAALWRRIAGSSRHVSRGAAWGSIIVCALLAFELFNFSTTEFALHDVLGDLSFGGLQWATVLAVAFCGIDFAGIARLFTPQQGDAEPAEVWYLFAAWLLAAAFNATLTWWGVSVAIAGHAASGSSAVLGDGTALKVVPVFVAIMVWLVRVLIIGSFSVAGDRLFSTSGVSKQAAHSARAARTLAHGPHGQPYSKPNSLSQPFRTAPKSAAGATQPVEPTHANDSVTYDPEDAAGMIRRSNRILQ